MKYTNIMENKTEELLVITAEECGELTQACSKILRHGMDDRLKNKLLEEVGDLQCMIDLLIEHDVLKATEIEDRKFVKRDKLKKYSNIWKK
jgi:NTP pyrophosphatase (non-canonical NTP hydrolase)